MEKVEKPLHFRRVRFAKLWAVMLIFIFVVCSLAGCSRGYFIQRFPLPLENDKIYWGIQETEFQTVMEKFDYEVTSLAHAPEDSLQAYAISSPLKTKYGQAADSHFLFNDKDELVMVRFFFADLSLSDLNATLTTQYGPLEKLPAAAQEKSAVSNYPGDYYIPDDATAEDLSEKEYQKMKNYLIAHPDILHNDASSNTDNLEAKVDDFLKNASVFVLKTGEYQNAETGTKGAFVEVNGEYLTLLSLLA